MPVETTAMPRPLISGEGGQYRKVRKPVGEHEDLQVKHPETGEIKTVSRQNFGDYIRLMGWEPYHAPEPKRVAPEEVEEFLDSKVEEIDRAEEVAIVAPDDPNDMDELQLLRHQYKTLTGETPDQRWGKKRIQEALDAAPRDPEIAD